MLHPFVWMSIMGSGTARRQNVSGTMCYEWISRDYLMIDRRFDALRFLYHLARLNIISNHVESVDVIRHTYISLCLRRFDVYFSLFCFRFLWVELGPMLGTPPPPTRKRETLPLYDFIVRIWLLTMRSKIFKKHWNFRIRNIDCFDERN